MCFWCLKNYPSGARSAGLANGSPLDREQMGASELPLHPHGPGCAPGAAPGDVALPDHRARGSSRA